MKCKSTFRMQMNFEAPNFKMAESIFSWIQQILFLNIELCTGSCGIKWDTSPFLNVSLTYVKITLKVSREI